jgi:hypothetical protein
VLDDDDDQTGVPLGGEVRTGGFRASESLNLEQCAGMVEFDLSLSIMWRSRPKPTDRQQCGVHFKIRENRKVQNCHATRFASPRPRVLFPILRSTYISSSSL